MLPLRLFFQPARRLFSLAHWSLQALFQASVRTSGIFLFLGGLIAAIGYVVASLNPSPLAATWAPSSWTVILGVIVLVSGMLGLYLQYLLRPGIFGRAGSMFLMLGTLVLVTGTATVDIFILPWMFKLIGELSGLSGQMQTAINQAMPGINSATSNLGNFMENGCKNILGLANQHCSATPAPQAAVPSLNSQSIANKLLSGIGLASLDILKTWGLTFLSGAPLALGCLLLGIKFLHAGMNSRIALLILICCALLNLGSTLPILAFLFPGLLGGLLVNLSNFFLLHASFLDTFGGVLFFLSIAWLGFTLWFPWKLHIPLLWQEALFDIKISLLKAGTSFKCYAHDHIKKILHREYT